MPPLPKHLSARARRNRAPGAAVLTLREPDGEVEIPKLPRIPDPGWHQLTIRWWVDVWSSPMSPEYDGSDVHGLFLLARLVDDYGHAESTSARIRIAGEIRLQSVRFGLSPIDRRRLQWEIERTEEAQEKGRKRTARQADQGDTGNAPTVGAAGRSDPRAILRDVTPIRPDTGA